ncbi:MAG: yndA [Chryseobacterium sp.]|jgi:GNAT superfamily N-acetyltransferase|nr:yndA [Chryseobacterium sp.]
MAINVKKVYCNNTDYKMVKELYKHAFPVIERLPLVLLRLMALKYNIEFYSVYDDANFCGLLYLVNNKGKTLIYYFAVRSDIRSMGYGTKILEWLKKEKNSISLIMETVREECDNAWQRQLRKEFYLKNGFKDTGYYMKDYSGTFDILSTDSDINPKEFVKLIKQFTFWMNIEVGKFYVS